MGFDRWSRWTARGLVTRWLGPRARVALAACPTYDGDLVSILRRVLEQANAPDLKGKRVVLKPNLVDSVAQYPSYTHPSVVQAMIRLVRESGGQVTVAEGPAFRRDAQGILESTGYAEMLAREQADFVDLNYDDLVAVPTRGGYTRMRTLLLPKTIHDADLIFSLPKLKTHHWSQVSLSVKNFFGIAAGIKYGWPKNTLHAQGITESIAELLDALPAQACAVIDGVLGMEGDGPLFGTGVPSGFIAAGTDLLAVDASCARLMGFEPERVDYMRFAAWAGLGVIDPSRIDMVGEAPEILRRRFQLPPTMR